MLVIVSDLHLTDGTGGDSIPPGAFSIFAERLEELALAASWRTEGGYRPIDRVDLVLLGDVLDVIRSAHWLENEAIRPWSDLRAPQAVSMVRDITRDILAHNAPGLAVLRRLSDSDGIQIPPADNRARPAYDTDPIPVPVRTFYMVGNHDWFYHLSGPDYDAIRQPIVEQLGLAHPHDEPFPHDPVENGELHDLMRRHRVLARHGDIHDPFNFEGDRDTSSLGDAIVIELLNRFSVEVSQQLGDELPDACLAGLRELDNIRPLLLAPAWIDGLLERSCPYPAVRKQVKVVWDRLADRFLELQFVRQRDTWSPADLVDGLERALKFSQRLSLAGASAVVTWLQELLGNNCAETYYNHALKEQEFRNRRASHIVYGHTHHVECVALDASIEDGRVQNQLYFNSGTWRRVHSQTRLAPSEREFIAQDVMTYLAFFQGDERKGRSYETWSGTLGAAAGNLPVYRIDAGAPTSGHVGAPRNGADGELSTPSLRGHAPHFPLGNRGRVVVPTRRVR